MWARFTHAADHRFCKFARTHAQASHAAIAGLPSLSGELASFSSASSSASMLSLPDVDGDVGSESAAAIE